MKLTKEQLVSIRDYITLSCVGYPVCDGDLIAEPHDPRCPASNRTEIPHEVLRIANLLDTIDALNAELADVKQLQHDVEARLTVMEDCAVIAESMSARIGHVYGYADDAAKLIREKAAALRAEGAKQP